MNLPLRLRVIPVLPRLPGDVAARVAARATTDADGEVISATVEAAQLELAEEGGGEVLLGDGRWLVARPVSLAQQMVGIAGAGRGRVSLEPVSALGSIKALADLAAAGTYLSDLDIRGVKGHGIASAGGSGMRVVRVGFFGVTGDAVAFAPGTYDDCYVGAIEGADVGGRVVAWRHGGVHASSGNVVEEITASGFGQVAVSIDQGIGLRGLGIVSLPAGKTGVEVVLSAADVAAGRTRAADFASVRSELRGLAIMAASATGTVGARIAAPGVRVEEPLILFCEQHIAVEAEDVEIAEPRLGGGARALTSTAGAHRLRVTGGSINGQTVRSIDVGAAESSAFIGVAADGPVRIGEGAHDTRFMGCALTGEIEDLGTATVFDGASGGEDEELRAVVYDETTGLAAAHARIDVEAAARVAADAALGDRLSEVEDDLADTFGFAANLLTIAKDVAITGSLNVSGGIIATGLAPGVVDFTHFADTIEPITVVDALPDPVGYAGTALVFLTTDGKVYRYVSGAWTTLVDADDIAGQLADAQIAALAASKITGQLTDAQIAEVAAAKISGQVVEAQIANAAITVQKMAAGLRPIESVDALPPSGVGGQVVFLTTDKKLYRWDGTGWTAAVAATDVTGQLTDAQLAEIAAAKVTGQLVASQIADAAITASKMVTSDLSNIFPDPGIDDPEAWEYNSWVVSANPVNTGFEGPRAWHYGYVAGQTGYAAPVVSPRFPVQKGQPYLYRYETYSAGAQQVWGRVHWFDRDDQPIAGGEGQGYHTIDSGVTVTGGRNCEKIITTPAATAMYARVYWYVLRDATTDHVQVSSFMVRRAVTEEWINNLAVTTGKIADSAITTAKLGALAVDASKLASNAVTETKISDGAISTPKLAANAVVADKIAANAIVASKLFLRGSSLILDPFIQDSGYWNPNTGVVVIVTDSDPEVAAMGVPGAMKFDVAAGLAWPSTRLHGWISPNHMPHLKPGTEYRATFRVKNVGCNRQLICQINRAIDGGSATVSVVVNPTDVEAQSATGKLVEVIWTTATNGLPRADVVPYVNITAGDTGFWYVSDIRIHERTSASMIVDGAIIATKLAAGSVETAKLAANAVTADKIAANTITASRLIVSDTSNVYPDPEMQDTGFYFLGAGSDFVTTGVSTSGFKRLRIAPNAAQVDCFSDYFPIEISVDYFVEVMASLDSFLSGTTATAQVWFQLYTLDALGNPQFSRTFKMAEATSASWARSSLNIATSTVERRGRFLFRRLAGGDATATFGLPVVRNRASAKLIVDGAVIASKISAGAVEAEKLAAAAVVADKIAADAVTAAKISAGAVEAAKIAAGAVLTDKLAASAVTADKIAAGAVVAGKIAAGAVVADAIGVGIGKNLLPNSSFYQGLDTWHIAPSGIAVTFALRPAGQSWAGYGYPTLMVYQADGDDTGYADVRWMKPSGYVDWRDVMVPVTPGKRYEASVQYSTHRCSMQLRIEYRYADGSTAYGGTITVPSNPQSSTNPDTWQRATLFHTAPANVVGATIHIRKLATDAGQVNSYLFLHKPFLGEATANQTEPSIWSEGGTTVIAGGGIVANAVSAEKIAAGAVVAEKIATGAVVAEKIAADAVTAAKITAGAVETAKIAAGAVDTLRLATNAVTADKIAANTITGDKIAANTLTAGAIASGAIGTDQLAANAVTADKVAAGTITGDKIAANTITTNQIAAGAINTDKLLARSVTTDRIAIGNVSEDLLATFASTQRSAVFWSGSSSATWHTVMSMYALAGMTLIVSSIHSSGAYQARLLLPDGTTRSAGNTTINTAAPPVYMHHVDQAGTYYFQFYPQGGGGGLLGVMTLIKR